MTSFDGRSVVDGLYKIARHEGLLSLWRGTDAAILMTVPLVAIYLPLYDTLMDNLTPLGTLLSDHLCATPFPFGSFSDSPVPFQSSSPLSIFSPSSGTVSPTVEMNMQRLLQDAVGSS